MELIHRRYSFYSFAKTNYLPTSLTFYTSELPDATEYKLILIESEFKTKTKIRFSFSLDKCIPDFSIVKSFLGIFFLSPKERKVFTHKKLKEYQLSIPQDIRIELEESWNLIKDNETHLAFFNDIMKIKNKECNAIMVRNGHREFIESRSGVYKRLALNERSLIPLSLTVYRSIDDIKFMKSQADEIIYQRLMQGKKLPTHYLNYEIDLGEDI